MKLGILGTGMIVKDVLTMYHELGVEKTYLFSTEKSNTTLGSGKIDYYAYLIEDEIKNEVYSNIYINVSNAKKELTNSDKYKSLVKEVTNSIEKNKSRKRKR